jgi:carboxylesterase
MLRKRLTALHQALQRRYVTLEDGRYGRLVGSGDPSSIRIDGPAGHGGLLAFHGYAGTPNEVRILTEVAARLGLFARAPRLAGHHDDVRHLLKRGWDDWVADATTGLFELAEATTRRVIVAGLSMGALLAAHLAARYPERVGGLIALANATRLRLPSPALILTCCELVRPLGNEFYIPKAGADIRDLDARRRHLTYDVTPMHGAVEVLRAGRQVRAELSRVTCPTLVIHGAHDQVCPPTNADRFARALGTQDVEVALMPNSGHIVTADADRAEVARLSEAFVRKVIPRL